MQEINNNKNKKKKKDRDITLMTVLAYENTDGARKLLKSYSKEDAKDYKDLEYKLAKLYFDCEDKPKLEKEMANIHPHKDWILECLKEKLDADKQSEINEIIERTKAEAKEENSNKKENGCNCDFCKRQQSELNVFSSFDASFRREQELERANNYQNNNNERLAMILGAGMVGVIALAIIKNKI